MDRITLLRQVRTPKKIGRLVLEPSYKSGAFDSHAVDSPFLFSYEGCFGMTCVGWDSIGYRTGLASSTDLTNWHKEGLILDHFYCAVAPSTTPRIEEIEHDERRGISFARSR